MWMSFSLRFGLLSNFENWVRREWEQTGWRKMMYVEMRRDKSDNVKAVALTIFQ